MRKSRSPFLFLQIIIIVMACALVWYYQSTKKPLDPFYEEVAVTGQTSSEEERCTAEGKHAGQPCCTGLTLIPGSICTKCGDSLCKEPENPENCPLDCTNIGGNIHVRLRLSDPMPEDVSTLIKGVSKIEERYLEVSMTPSTVFYWTADDMTEKDYYSYSEFRARLKEIYNRWPLDVIGSREDEDTIIATDVFIYAQ